MTINLSLPQKESEIKPRITVVGVGGAGGNAVNNMISAALEGVEFIVANTDAQALGQSLADRRVQLGITITQGLGAGARPEVGRQAAEEALPEILQLLDGANMVFVTAGMGGGTGTGAAPVVAKAARELGIATIGLTGRAGGKLHTACDIAICVPADEANHIQEMHIAIGHYLCGFVENAVG